MGDDKIDETVGEFCVAVDGAGDAAVAVNANSLSSPEAACVVTVVGDKFEAGTGVSDSDGEEGLFLKSRDVGPLSALNPCLWFKKSCEVLECVVTSARLVGAHRQACMSTLGRQVVQQHVHRLTFSMLKLSVIGILDSFFVEFVLQPQVSLLYDVTLHLQHLA